MRKILVGVVICMMTAGLMVGCGGDKAQKKETTTTAAPALAAEKANVTGAKHVGAAGKMQPIIEITGTLPGTGYDAKVNEKRDGNKITLSVMAVPGEGAEKGEAQAFTTKYTIKDLASGAWTVYVKDARGVDAAVLNFEY